MLRRKLPVLLLFILSLAAGLSAQNQPDTPAFDVKEHYTKYEYRIAMRDGVHLFTSVYVPKDSSHSYPFLIDRDGVIRNDFEGTDEKSLTLEGLSAEISKLLE